MNVAFTRRLECGAITGRNQLQPWGSRVTSERGSWKTLGGGGGSHRRLRNPDIIDRLIAITIPCKWSTSLSLFVTPSRCCIFIFCRISTFGCKCAMCVNTSFSLCESLFAYVPDWLKSVGGVRRKIKNADNLFRICFSVFSFTRFNLNRHIQGEI